MSTADRDRWDARFAGLGAGEPGPPALLAGREELVPRRGRALDLACGRGTVAVWLARRGLTVDAVDVSPVGLAAGRAATDTPTDGAAGAVTWIEADLDDGLPAGVAGGPYVVIVCQRFRDPALYPAMIDALAPGGLLAVSVLSEAGDSGGAFRAPPGELLVAFGALTVLHHEEGHGEEGLVALR